MIDLDLLQVLLDLLEFANHGFLFSFKVLCLLPCHSLLLVLALKLFLKTLLLLSSFFYLLDCLLKLLDSLTRDLSLL